MARRRVRLLVAALILLPLGAATTLAWHWKAFAPRSWPEGLGPGSLAFTDDGRFVVSLDEKGTLRCHDLENPFDRWLGASRSFPFGHWHVISRAFTPRQVILSRAVGSDSCVLVGFEGEGRRRLGSFSSRDASLDRDVLLTRSFDEPEKPRRVRRLSQPDEILWTTPDVDIWALSPDGREVVFAKREAGAAALSIRDSITGEVRGERTAPLAVVRRLAYLDTGAILAFDDDGRVTRFERGDVRGVTFSCSGLLWGSGGERVLLKQLANAETFRVADARTGATLLDLGASPDACLSHDGTRVAFAKNGRVEVVRVP